uniref:DJ-1/PfpI domain-containing protein n=1 Tax=Peronospora matthiolae TaxID=2874970 RepID=A0AAV1UCK2_9STRA
MMAGGLSEYTAVGHDNLPLHVLPRIKPRALIIVADGSDELETLALSDILVRGGLHVIIGSVGQAKNNIIVANYGLHIQAEKSMDKCSIEIFDLIVVPGGDGASHLRDSDLVTKMLLEQKEAGRWIAASSSAPAVVLSSHGLLGTRATCSLPHEPEMTREFVDEDIVVDNRCVTTQGAGTVIKFALTLVKLIMGEAAAGRAAGELLCPWP